MIREMRTLKLFFICIILVGFFNLGDFFSDRSHGQDNQPMYSSETIVSESRGGLIYETPTRDFPDGEVAISPPLPEGLSFFSNSWVIDGRLMDTYGKRVCIIIGDGSASCWNNTSESHEFPTSISPKILSGGEESIFTSVSVGFEFSCGILRLMNSESRLYCWGAVGFDSMDYEEKIRIGTTNIVKFNKSGWTHISVGKTHVCGVVQFIEVYCWGNGEVGQLGVGDVVFSSSPVLVVNSSTRILQLESGAFHTCMLQSGGYVDCWGWNNHGQVGVGDEYESRFPSRVAVPPSMNYSLSLGGFFSCLVSDSESRVFCWGDNRGRQISVSENDVFLLPRTIAIDRIGANKIGSSIRNKCILYSEYDLVCQGPGIENGMIEITLSKRVEEILPLEEKVCFVEINRRFSCVNYDSSLEIVGLPIGANSFILPLEIPRGAISGVPVREFIGDFYVTNPTGSVLEEFRIDVNFEQDTDYDGWSDTAEISCNSHPYNATIIPLDTDGDSICNRFDLDDDGDGHSDNIDRFPLDITEWRDDDRDGIGKNSDSFEVSPGIKSGILTFSVLIIMLFIEVISIRSGRIDVVETRTVISNEE